MYMLFYITGEMLVLSDFKRGISVSFYQKGRQISCYLISFGVNLHVSRLFMLSACLWRHTIIKVFFMLYYFIDTEASFLVQLLTHLPGISLYDARTPLELLGAVGRFTGRMDHVLKVILLHAGLIVRTSKSYVLFNCIDPKNIYNNIRLKCLIFITGEIVASSFCSRGVLNCYLFWC